jgi:hypothetical protein
MTRESNPNLVKWKNWLGTDGTGIFPYGTAGTEALWYRPHQKCLMQALSYPFCPVCKEAIVQEILQQFGNPVRSVYPEQQNLTVTGQNVRFNISLYKPDPNTIRTRWFLNGKIIASNTDSLMLKAEQLIAGDNTLSVQVLDTTALIRSESHASANTYTTNWLVNKKANAAEDRLFPGTLKIYPNPVTEELTITYGGSHKNTRYDIINAVGQVVLSGNFSGRKVIDARFLVPGTYWVKLDNGQSVEFLKL